MKRIRPVVIKIVFFLLLFISMGCSPIKPFKVVKVDSFTIAESKGFGLTIKTDITINNPNHHSLTIKNSDIDVFIEGVYLGKLVMPKNLKIPSDNDFLAHLAIDVNFGNMIVAGKNLFKKIHSGSFDVSLKGKLHVRYLFFTKEVDVETTNKVKL